MVKPKIGDWIITKPRWYRKEFLTQVVDVDKHSAYFINYESWACKGNPIKAHVDFDRLAVITKEVADIMRGV